MIATCFSRNNSKAWTTSTGFSAHTHTLSGKIFRKDFCLAVKCASILSLCAFLRANFVQAELKITFIFRLQKPLHCSTRVMEFDSVCFHVDLIAEQLFFSALFVQLLTPPIPWFYFKSLNRQTISLKSVLRGRRVCV